MAPQMSNSVHINQQRVTQLFEDLQLELEKQKHLLLDQIEKEAKIAINQQRYDGIINHLQELVTVSNVDDDLSPSNGIIQTSPIQKHDKNINEIHTMDHCSAWFKNKQLWQFIEQRNDESLHNAIITNLFTDFPGLMDHLLKTKFNLSVLQHNQLYNILLNYSSNSHDIFNNYRPKNDRITITSIPDHCLSYIMQFLTQNIRYVVQRTCRLFAVAIRQEGAVNDITEDFRSMYMVPNLRKIIDGIQSDDKDKNDQALQLFAKHMSKFQCILKSRVEQFDDDTWRKLVDLVLAHNSELNNNIGLFLFDMGVCAEMIPVGMKYLKNVKEITGPNSNDADSIYPVDIISAVCALGYKIDNFIYHPDIVPALLHVIQEMDNYQCKDPLDKERLLAAIYSCICEVSKFGLIEANQLLVDGGYMDVIQKFLAEKAGTYSSRSIWYTLNGFLDTPGLITVDELFNKYNLFGYMVKHPNYSWMVVIKVCEVGTHEQRIRVIEGILSEKTHRNLMRGGRCQKILDVLEKIGDTVAYSRLTGYKTTN